MRFYTEQQKFYCGIDWHARTMYVCILNQDGEILVHRNMKAGPETFLKTIAPYREHLVVCVEGLFTWYWLADLCAQAGIPFILGHALYMKAMHGGKAKNATRDADKIAMLLRGGMIPQASVYPAQRRPTRDPLRRRMHLMRKRAALLTHIQKTNRQYTLPAIGKKIAYKANRAGVAERFPDPAVQKSIEADLALIDHDERLLSDLALYIVQLAKHHEANAFYRRRSIPGVGKIRALVRLYEIHDIHRFPRVQACVSDGRLVNCAKEAAGKRDGRMGAESGNACLKWAFAEAAVLFLRNNPAGQKVLARLERKQGKGKALTVFAHQLARAVYDLLRRETAFNRDKFLNQSRDGAREPDASLDAHGISLGMLR
jgi:Transposase/Transposase IS116/IS110/IS902 family